ncbi:MAG: outer membrane beta-barrel protein [Inquilinus sp.]|nr:outer membrane beta-barrel protein [Inquilinus sp.]
MPIPRFIPVAVAALLATTATARAEGFYLGVQGGYNGAVDAELNEDCGILLCISDGTAVYDPGAAIGVVFGLDMSGGWRLEGELTYRENRFDEIEWFDGLRQTDGRITSTALMGNVIYDYEADSVQPYLGAGIGAVNVSFDDVRDVDGALFDGSETVLAGQFIGGVGLTLAPSTTLYIDYRAMLTEDVSLVIDPGQRASIAGDPVDVEYFVQSVMIGIRHEF